MLVLGESIKLEPELDDCCESASEYLNLPSRIERLTGIFLGGLQMNNPKKPEYQKVCLARNSGTGLV